MDSRFAELLPFEGEDEPTAPTVGALLSLADEARGALLRDEAGNLYDLSDDVTCIGRSEYRSVQLWDNQVSRKHAEIVRRAARWYVVDCKTPNGTFVNEVRIQGEVPLWPGDRLRIGRTTFVFDRGDVQGFAPAV